MNYNSMGTPSAVGFLYVGRRRTPAGTRGCAYPCPDVGPLALSPTVGCTVLSLSSRTRTNPGTTPAALRWRPPPAAAAGGAGYPSCSGICALSPLGSGDPRQISVYLLVNFPWRGPLHERFGVLPHGPLLLLPGPLCWPPPHGLGAHRPGHVPPPHAHGQP
jgi:hypothetical protein